MVLVVCLHLLRVFYSGAYKPPRQFNWVVGVGLLVLTLLMSFTGYLLPWDQLSYWAITVGTNIAGYVPIFGNTARNVLLGGPEVGQRDAAALLRAAHLLRACADLHHPRHPHLARAQGRVRGLGSRATTPSGSEEERGGRRCRPEPEPRYRLLGVVEREIEQRDEQEPDDTVSTWPHFLIRHVVVGAGTILLVFALAILFNAPLQEIANPSPTPAEAKAPWYFAGLQELLSHLQPMVAGILIPGAALLFLLALPYLDRSKGWRIRDRKMVVIVFTALALSALVLTVIGAFFRGPGWTWVWPWQHLYLEL